MAFMKLKIFKLKYSGQAEVIDESSELIYDVFSPVNIIYVYAQKKLYVWVGSQVSPTLKNTITLFREKFPDNYPELRVLRYITIDEKSEPWDFFQDTDFSKELLYERIDSYQEKLTPIINEIKELHEKADELFEAEKYPEAIEIAYKILEKALQVDDKPLKKDQEEFIAECELREKFKELMNKMQVDREKLKLKLDSIQTSDDIESLHAFTLEYKKKYEEYLDFSKFPEIKQLFVREEKTWKQYEDQKSLESSTETLIIKIDELRRKAKEALEKAELIDSRDTFNKIITLLTEANQSPGGIGDE